MITTPIRENNKVWNRKQSPKNEVYYVNDFVGPFAFQCAARIHPRFPIVYLAW